MQRVVNFANGQKLLGEDGNGLSRLGISFGDSLVMGNSKQIKLRFDPTYLQLATDQQL
jgi:NitT/TauT family transport system substrate-binding protein